MIYVDILLIFMLEVHFTTDPRNMGWVSFAPMLGLFLERGYPRLAGWFRMEQNIFLRSMRTGVHQSQETSEGV